MIIITLQRKKCIGCGHCEQIASDFFRMSKKDGKSVLLESLEKKGFFTKKIINNSQHKELETASKICPVKIISISFL